MVIGNTFIIKDSENLITFMLVVTFSVIAVKKELMKGVKDVKVIPGEECFSPKVCGAGFLDYYSAHGSERLTRPGVTS